MKSETVTFCYHSYLGSKGTDRSNQLIGSWPIAGGVQVQIADEEKGWQGPWALIDSFKPCVTQSGKDTTVGQHAGSPWTVKLQHIWMIFMFLSHNYLEHLSAEEKQKRGNKPQVWDTRTPSSHTLSHLNQQSHCWSSSLTMFIYITKNPALHICFWLEQAKMLTVNDIEPVVSFHKKQPCQNHYIHISDK